MAQTFHYKSEGRVLKNHFKKVGSESVGTDFRLIFRPWIEYRAGLSGSSEKGVDPTTGKLVNLGNTIMMPASRFQLDVVVVEDAVTGLPVEVVDSQSDGHKVIKVLRYRRQPKPERIKVNV